MLRKCKRFRNGIAVLAVGLCALPLLGCPGNLDSRFAVNVERDFDTAEEALLIGVAEAAYPPREEVAALADAHGVDPASLPEEGLWWYDTQQDIRIPYAITAEAIDYYADKVEESRDLARVLRPRYGMRMNASLDYFATIAYHSSYQHGGQTFTGVFAVEMSLDWEYQTRPLSTMHFGKERVVILTPAGEVLAVFGDGETDIPIL